MADEISNICFIDFETTGLSPFTDYAIEVGAILVDDNDNILKKFHSYIKPNDNYIIDESSYAIHGISEKVISGAPSELEVLTSIFAQLGTNYRFAAWNMSFDISFFKALCYRNSFESLLEKLSYRHIDVQTLSFIAKKLGYISKDINSLSDLTDYLGLSRSKLHSAEEDVELLYTAYKFLLSLLKEKAKG